MRLIFYGELKKRFGESVVMATDTVADAVEGYSRQVDWPHEMRISVVAGQDRLDSMEKLSDYHEEVHLIPAMSGGSGKFTNILLGAALVVGGIIAGGFATPIGTSLIISGSLMIAQGVIGLFMKAPKVQSVNDPEASKYLNVNKNTTEVGTLATMAWGRIDLAGQWVSLQSDSNNLAFGVFPAQPA